LAGRRYPQCFQIRLSGVRIPAGQAIAVARAHPRVRELLAGHQDVRAEANFAEQWQVWIVRFFVADRLRLGK